MTQFKDFEILYNQFLNLTSEINKIIEQEDYLLALEKLKHKDKLIKKIMNAEKTVKFSVEERQKIQLINEKLKEDEQNKITYLKKLHAEVGEELKKTRKKVKFNSAYTINTKKLKGKLIDTLE